MTISLNDMSRLVAALKDADTAVEAAEENLKQAKEYARRLREETIPSSMQELGLESLVTDDGMVLRITQEVYASIPSGGKAAAYKWLEDNGFGGMIKTDVTVNYGKEELEAAIALFKTLKDRGLHASIDQSVHVQTLKAFLKEQLSKGSNIPLELFGARPVWTAKITKK